MSWAVGYDRTWQRDIGYGVPATCDQPGCSAEIDRGLGYVCQDGEPFGGDDGCGLYFCADHLGDECHHVFKDDPAYQSSADTAEWISWKLTDESWQRWRDENPEEVARLMALAGRCSPMADDPRLLEAADFLKADVGRVATAAEIETATDMLRELDALDPLRALLADEDQAVELVAGVIGRNMVIRKGPPEIASAVLAALREVGGL